MWNGLLVIALALLASCGSVSSPPGKLPDAGDTTDARVGARSISAVSGDGQSGAAGAQLAAPFVVAVTEDDQPVMGAQVNFSVVAGNGSMSQTVVMTDTAGH